MLNWWQRIVAMIALFFAAEVVAYLYLATGFETDPAMAKARVALVMAVTAMVRT